MENATRMGLNRTGAQMAPRATPDMEAAARESTLQTPGDETEIAMVRGEYIADADRIGSVPVPGTLKGMATTGLQKLTGKNPEVLIDKMGERLAFERTGTRLYEALLAKIANGSEEAQMLPPIAEIERIREDEAMHFRMLVECMASLGADPTAQTPCADVAGVQSLGVMQVLGDPRTTVAQCLNAILTAELTDHAGWDLLIALAQQSGQDELVQRFTEAMRTEEEHLAKVQRWLRQEVLEQAT
jgi:rubrerythrin